jgi:hypothetical protein
MKSAHEAVHTGTWGASWFTLGRSLPQDKLVTDRNQQELIGCPQMIRQGRKPELDQRRAGDHRRLERVQRAVP